MNPQLPTILQELECRDFDFEYEFHTNGVLVTRQDADDIVSVMRRGQVFVSIDGGTAEAHDFNRGHGTFRKAIRAAQLLIKARGQHNTPRLGIYQLDMGERESDYDSEFLEVARKVDEWVRIAPINPKTGERNKTRRVSELDKHKPTVQQTPPHNRWWANETPEDAPPPNGPCFWVGNSMFLAPDGNVSVCLLSHTSDGIVGNIKSDSVAKIMNNVQIYRQMIEQRGRACVTHCNRCRMVEGSPLQTINSNPLSLD